MTPCYRVLRNNALAGPLAPDGLVGPKSAVSAVVLPSRIVA